MNFRQIHWGFALVGALAAEVVMIAASILWVAIYSYLIHPGETSAVYAHYAMISAPWVSILTGIPAFYLISRRAGAKAEARSPGRAWPTAMGLFAIYLLIDLPFAIFGSNPSMAPWFLPVNYLAKFLACHFGGASSKTLAANELESKTRF